MIRNIHCRIGRRTTGKPPTSLLPSTTSSLAKTVPSPDTNSPELPRHKRAGLHPGSLPGYVEIGSALSVFRIEPGIVDLEKDPLGPLVIARISGVDLAIPIVGKTDAFELRFKLGDILARGDFRMLAALDRVLLGRQTKRVPAHRVQDVETAHPFVPRDDVGGGVALGMPDMQASAARIRKHIEDVELRLR